MAQAKSKSKAVTATQITLPAGVKSLAEYEAVLLLSCRRLNEAWEREFNELAKVRDEIAKQRKAEVKAPKAKPTQKAAAGTQLVIDATTPLSTQTQAVAKHLGLRAVSVYNEKTKTKGRKIKLHQVYASKGAAQLTRRAFNKFEQLLRKHADANGIVIRSIEMVPPPGYASWAAPSIVVFFEEKGE